MRRALDVAAVISMLLLIGVTIMWHRSYGAMQLATWGGGTHSAGTSHQLWALKGVIAYQWMTSTSPPAQLSVVAFQCPVGWADLYFLSGASPLAGFAFELHRSGADHSGVIGMPCWAACVALLIAPVAWTMRRRRASRRKRGFAAATFSVASPET